MRDRDFTVRNLNKNFDSENCKVLFRELQAAEDQAIALVELFHKESYLTVDKLFAKLRNQQVSEVDLRLVVAFLVGYLTGESYESRFDVEVFGQYSVSEAKYETANASLLALLTMINEKSVLSLPNRCSEASTKKKRRTSVRGEK